MADIVLGVAVFLVALCAMEFVAWATHRYVMHGFLWSLHRSHHEPRTGVYERNDLFAFFFAGTAIAMFWFGSQPGWGLLTWGAAGVTAYGALYALVHDGLVHERFPFKLRPRGSYLTRLVQAHRLHHAVASKEGAVSFGFLLPTDPRRLAAALKEKRAGGAAQMRDQSAGRSSVS